MKKPHFFGIDDYVAPYYPYIKTEKPWSCRIVICRVMMDGDRKSVEPMPEKVHTSERGMQRLLTEVKWDCEVAFGEHRNRMLAKTVDPRAVMYADLLRRYENVDLNIN